MVVSEVTNNVPIRPVDSFGTFDGGLWFVLALGFGFIIAGMIIYIIILKWFGNGKITAMNAWKKGFAIIQHFETGKNATLKLAKVEGNAFRHQKVEDGTVIAMPKGVNLLGSKLIINTWALFGTTVPAYLLAGITILENVGLATLKDVESQISIYEDDFTTEQQNTPAKVKNDVLRGTSVLVEGYDFSDFRKVLTQTEQRYMIPLSIENVQNYIQKSTNPHVTEDTIIRQTMPQISKFGDPTFKVFFMIGLFMLISGLAFIVIYNQITGASLAATVKP